jgi:hypothetical protein
MVKAGTYEFEHRNGLTIESALTLNYIVVAGASGGIGQVRKAKIRD